MIIIRAALSSCHDSLLFSLTPQSICSSRLFLFLIFISRRRILLKSCSKLLFVVLSSFAAILSRSICSIRTPGSSLIGSCSILGILTSFIHINYTSFLVTQPVI